MKSSELTHIDKSGNAQMVDVGDKPITQRFALARGEIVMLPKTLQQILGGEIKKGDFVLCDFGASFKKYNSDTTRTFVYGNATDQQKEMYETVLKAQQIAFDMIKDGVEGSDVHNAVDSFINTTKFKGRFIHSTGHSLGLAVHDGGIRLSNKCEVELKENT